MRPSFAILLVALLLAAGPSAQQVPEKTLDVYFIDVEGGHATLYVSPSGESMLVDAGYPGFEGRDAGRIVAAVKNAGLTRIDYLVVTHYHSDHVGGVPQLAERIPIRTFVDHGPTSERGTQAALYETYLQTRSKGTHLPVRPGDRIPIGGMTVQVLTSATMVRRRRSSSRSSGRSAPLRV